MITDLIDILKSKKLLLEILDTSSDAMIMTFDVWAKPGAKIEKSCISKEGILIIQTRSRAVEGEANQAITEVVSVLFGIPKSQVEICRGDKSRLKKIKVKIEYTANKKESFYKKKFIEILGPEA